MAALSDSPGGFGVFGRFFFLLLGGDGGRGGRGRGAPRMSNEWNTGGRDTMPSRLSPGGGSKPGAPPGGAITLGRCAARLAKITPETKLHLKDQIGS